MNMARAILERVAEVELQVTPEFRKTPSPKDPGETHAPKMIRKAIEAVDGWEMKESSTGGGAEYHVQMKFKHRLSDDVIVVRVGVDSGIMSAVVERPSGKTDILTPELDNIVQRAQAIESWVG